MNNDFCPHLEIQVTEHCNLNCASCTHFSPLAEPKYIDKATFFEQLKAAYVIFKNNCKSLKIMGGEPLLHPEIEELLVLARKAMPDINLTLQTNGILLTSLADSFWCACHDNNILIRVTRYPVKLDMEKIDEKVKQFDVELKYHPSDSAIKSFNLYPLNLNVEQPPQENYENCKMKMRYVLIKEERLFPCPIAGNAEHFNHAFEQQLTRCENDSVSIYEIKDFEDYIKFAREAIPFCRFCMPTQYRRDVGWTRSKKSITEWT